MPLRRLLLWPALFATLAVPVVAGEVHVRAADGQLDVQAERAPLVEVLDRIAQQTGMKWTSDGAPPRPLVTLTLEKMTAAQVIPRLFAGLGVSYAMTMDAAGTRVVSLILVSSGASAARPGASRSTPSIMSSDEEPGSVPPPMSQPDTPPPPPPVPPPSATPLPPAVMYPTSPFAPAPVMPQAAPPPAAAAPPEAQPAPTPGSEPEL